MLTIDVVVEEKYNDETQRFENKKVRLELEHSLASLSKWESKFKVPFMGPKKKTPEQLLWYIKAMCLTPDIPDEVFNKLSEDNVKELNEYIADDQTATWFRETPNMPQREQITSELIYYWMISLNIPFECQNWHLNRLMTLVRVCNTKNAPPVKQDAATRAKEQRELNERRRAEMGTNG